MSTTIPTITTIELYNNLYDKNIRELNLCWNRIINICPEIKQFENLQTCNLCWNRMINICPEIGQLRNLQTLDFNFNKIINICPEIAQLQNLQRLTLRHNQITNICPEIGQLQNLLELALDENRIINICPEIGQLNNLRELYLGYNKITNLCSEIGRLRNLQALYLMSNRITNVCPEIGQLRNLQILFLNDNQITIIPADIIQCNNLLHITYHNNNIEHIIPCVQRVLDRIRDGGGTIINIYNDRQNVHASSIQTSVRNSIFNLLNTHYKPDEINKINETNKTDGYIEDLVLTTKTKQLITEYIFIKETHSQLDCTFEEIFKAVWNEILTLNVDFQNEVKKRLNEEMDDAECKCFTGRISRLVNCLSGYSDKVLIQISDAEQIGNIISHVRSKYKDSSIDEIKQIVKKELTERTFDANIIEEWISYIN